MELLLMIEVVREVVASGRNPSACDEPDAATPALRCSAIVREAAGYHLKGPDHGAGWRTAPPTDRHLSGRGATPEGVTAVCLTLPRVGGNPADDHVAWSVAAGRDVAAGTILFVPAKRKG